MRRNNKRHDKPLSPCVTVTAADNKDDPDRMIRRFRKLVKNEGIIEECRHRRHFRSQSEKRREQKEDKQRLIDKVNKRRDELLKPRDRFIKRRS
jgi:ribosomal protein S21